MRSWLGFAWLWVSATTVVVGCGGSPSGSASQGSMAPSATGQGLYEDRCAMCHGDGTGSEMPPLVGPDAFASYDDAQALFDYLKANMPLPPAKIGSLTDEEYYKVTGFLVERSGRPVPPGGLDASNAASVPLR